MPDDDEEFDFWGRPDSRVREFLDAWSKSSYTWARSANFQTSTSNNSQEATNDRPRITEILAELRLYGEVLIYDEEWERLAPYLEQSLLSAVRGRRWEMHEDHQQAGRVMKVAG